MTTPVPVCGACESNLRQVRSKWVCCESGCPLQGQEQTVLPNANDAARYLEGTHEKRAQR